VSQSAAATTAARRRLAGQELRGDYRLVNERLTLAARFHQPTGNLTTAFHTAAFVENEVAG
jgi:hypothetical protein